MNCPRCSAAMTEESYGGVQLDLCDTCPGVWFDLGELEACRASHEARAVLGGVEGLDRRFEYTGDSLHVRCPRCEHDILRSGRVGRTEVYRCTTCGGIYLPLPDPNHRQPRRAALIGTAVRALQDLVNAVF